MLSEMTVLRLRKTTGSRRQTVLPTTQAWSQDASLASNDADPIFGRDAPDVALHSTRGRLLGGQAGDAAACP